MYIHGVFGRQINEYKIKYGAYNQFWPTLSIYQQ